MPAEHSWHAIIKTATEGLQQLVLVNRLVPSVLDGTKTSTIRWNEAPVTPGLLRYVGDEQPHPSVIVMVTDCTSLLLSDAAQHLGRQAEWPPSVMLAGMREHYPTIELTDTNTVVRHLTPAQAEPVGQATDCM